MTNVSGMIKFCGTVLMIASPTLAQETLPTDEAFYKFVEVVPNALALPNGDSADVIVEFFSTPSGTIGSIRATPIALDLELNGQTTCDTFENPKGACVMCAGWDEPFCTWRTPGRPSVLRELDFDLIVVPQKTEDGGLDFNIDLQQIVRVPIIDEVVPGFSLNPEGQLVPRLGADE